MTSRASLAQLAEHALRKRMVVGSIPTGGFFHGNADRATPLLSALRNTFDGGKIEGLRCQRACASRSLLRLKRFFCAKLQAEKPKSKPAIAQLVEHLTVDCCSNQMVPGSIPGRRMHLRRTSARPRRGRAAKSSFASARCAAAWKMIRFEFPKRGRVKNHSKTQKIGGWQNTSFS